jgi:hypothetical protein
MGLLLLPVAVFIGLNGYAWSENIGWLSFQGPAHQVTINDETGAYGGYAWSSHIGWVKFTGDRARVCSATEGGDCSAVVSDNVSGWDGIIKFSGVGYKTEIIGMPETGCSLTGYAWGSDVVGWIKMKGVNYGVNLERCIVPPEPPKTYDLSCTFNAGPRVLVAPQKTARLTWACSDADKCTITPSVGTVTPTSAGGVTVAPKSTTTYTLHCENDGNQSVDISKKVEVVKSQLCEINPADPSCD